MPSNDRSLFARQRRWLPLLSSLLLLLPLLTACGGDDAEAGSADRGGSQRAGRPGGGAGGPGGPGGAGAPKRGVPVEITRAERRPIALFFETQGTLEAENEVDLIARVSGPVLELHAEQGDRVRKGELLAKIDDREIRAQLGVSQVRLAEAKQSYERVKKLHDQQLISSEAFEAAQATYEATQGEREQLLVQLEYTNITAPFAGLVSERYVKLAEMVQNGSQLFHLVDFDPLLVPIRVPERELSRLALGQKARIEVEAFGDRSFDAEVLRMSPVIDSATGTIEVTLKAAGEGMLRPGMFATVYLEMDRRAEALVVPKSALALDSLGNTVYAVKDGTAQRRDLQIGFRNEDLLEVLSGLEDGEQVVVVGQDGLADGTPVEVVEARTLDGEPLPGFEDGEDDAPAEAASAGSGPRGAGGPGGPGGGGAPDFLRNMDWDDEEQVDRLRSRMKERGMSDDEVEERIRGMKERFGGGSGGGSAESSGEGSGGGR